MKLLIVACLCMAAHAGLFDDSVDAEAHGAAPMVSHTLDGTFLDVWKAIQGPLVQAGQEVLKQAGQFAQDQGLTLALMSLANGKRETTDEATIKSYLSAILVDEYQKWLKDIEKDILGSKDEMAKAVNKADAVDELPGQLKKYIDQYVDAVTNGEVATFVSKQADVAFRNAISQLKDRLNDRVLDAINKLSAQ